MSSSPDTGTWAYDFGDDWTHDVQVEVLGGPAQHAACQAGERACPPEDSGGPWGYADMLVAVKDREHPEHEEYVEWLGAGFDPEAFDLDLTDGRLRSIR